MVDAMNKTPASLIKYPRAVEPDHDISATTISAKHRQPKTPECFVVMPFGQKILPDGVPYDFDRVYRLIIRRAIEEAGMRARRADETVGSSLIHSDMFRDLRDRAVVLADLSLENPNVFYELGIRHVMSPTGTVLICKKGTTLPFDVKLSRVIFYDYQGGALDWEEVENTVSALKMALGEAASDQLDSPVHALLEQVSRLNVSEFSWRETTPRAHGAHLPKYQKNLAQAWFDGNVEINTLLDEHMRDNFGLRALGYYCLRSSDLTGVESKVAGQLTNAEQYDLATELYKKLKVAGTISRSDLVRFAGACADGCPDLQHIETAIGYVYQALQANESVAISEVVTFGNARLGSLFQKKWELTEDSTFLGKAIDAYEEALQCMESARTRGEFKFPGMIAHVRLKLLALRRKGGLDLRREDLERHRDKIMKILQWPEEDDPVSVSYLHWAQAVAMADLGRIDEAKRIMDTRLVEDSKLAERCIEVGGRQYVTIRRFLERYHDALTNTGVISRRLCVCLRP